MTVVPLSRLQTQRAQGLVPSQAFFHRTLAHGELIRRLTVNQELRECGDNISVLGRGGACMWPQGACLRLERMHRWYRSSCSSPFLFPSSPDFPVPVHLQVAMRAA